MEKTNLSPSPLRPLGHAFIIVCLHTFEASNGSDVAPRENISLQQPNGAFERTE